MDRQELEEAVQEFQEDNSRIRTLQVLKDFLVSGMKEFPAKESDANEHKLNMLIRDLEEDLDKIENEKLGDWDPAQG
jgi:hypothetical protein